MEREDREEETSCNHDRVRPSRPNTRIALLALAGCILLLAARVYLYNLTGWLRHDDEGVYLYQAWRVSQGELPYQDFMSSQWPLFLYAGGVIINFCGPSVWALRAFSVILFLATAGMLFFLVRRTLGSAAAVLAVLIFFMHPDTFEQARFFQSEALLLFFTVGGLCFLQRAREERYRRRWLMFLAGVSFALALLSKSLGLFPLAGAGLTILLDAISRADCRRQIPGGALALALGFILIAGIVLGSLALAVPDLYGSLVGHHLYEGERQTLVEALSGGIQLYRRFSQAYPLLVGLALGYSVLQMAARGSTHREGFYLFAGQILATLGFLILSRKLMTRHLMYAIPSLAALAAASLLALSALARRLSSWVAVLVLIGLLAVQLLPWGAVNYRMGKQHEDDTMRVVAHIQERTTPDDIVLSDYPGLNFYARRRAPYSGAEVSNITVTNGRVTGQRLVEEMAAEGVRMVIIDVGTRSGHHLIRLADYPRLFRYLRSHFVALPPMHRQEETLMVYWAEVPPDSPRNPVIIQYPQAASLNDEIIFLGYDLERTSLAPGETLRLRLYWRAERPVLQDWSIFTHLLDFQQKVRGQMDKAPLDGLYPTSRWLPGEVVDDDFELILEDDAPPGEYRLEVGMYNWQTLERLPAFAANGQRLPDDRILLERTVTVGD